MSKLTGSKRKFGWNWELSADILLSEYSNTLFPLSTYNAISRLQYLALIELKHEQKPKMLLSSFNPEEAAMLCLIIHHAGFTPADFNL